MSDLKSSDLRGIAPSILASDFGVLRSQVQEVLDAGAKVIHIDVMDGHFVPPITMGPLVVDALKQMDAILDVHLMVDRPERHLEQFAQAGADVLTVHAEATPQLRYALDQARNLGALAGLAVCPGSSCDVFAENRDSIDLALCMTVNPGWGGQKYIQSSPDKIRRIHQLMANGNPGSDFALQVDGGIDLSTIASAAAAGANLFVAGSAVFSKDSPGQAVQELADAARSAAANFSLSKTFRWLLASSVLSVAGNDLAYCAFGN